MARISSLALIAGLFLFPAVANAQSGSWSQAAAGVYNWSDTRNWTGGVVADGANNTATFATAGLTGAMNITLDSARTIGSLAFDNPTNTFGWAVQGTNTLTLSNASGPTIAVNNSRITATVSSPLAGSQGFTKTGPGILALTGNNTYTGGTTINSGTVVANPGSLSSGPVTLAGCTLAVGPRYVLDGFGGIATGGSYSGWTVNGPATFPSVNVLQMTPATGGVSSGWFNTPIGVGGPFTIKFTLSSPTANAGGMTIGFQNAGLTALGAGGNEFGYTGIAPSAAVALNFNPPYTQGGIGSGVGLLTNGASPSTIAPMRSTAPVNLVGGMFQPPDPAQITIAYDGANISVSIMQGAATYSSPALPINVTSAVGSSGLFGFTDSTAGVLSQLQISNFTFTSAGYNTPLAPAPATYANNVVVTNSSTITVKAPTGVPTVTMGTLTMAAGVTLNVAPDPTDSGGSPFGLAFASTTLSGASIFNVAKNAEGSGMLSLGPVANGSGTGALTLTGGGTLILGAAGSYTGPTAVNAGTLRVANPSGSATGSGAITVGNGGILAGGDGGGSANPFADSTQGFIAGPVTVQSGGILAPGSSVGLLTVSNNVTFESGSTFAVQLGTNVHEPGNVALVDNNSNDRIHTALDVLFGSTLTLDIDGMGQSFTNGLTYAFFVGRADGSIGPLPATVTFVPSDFGNPSNPANFALSVSPDGHELILTYTPTPVPEPGGLALVTAAGLGFVRVLRRGRR